MHDDITMKKRLVEITELWSNMKKKTVAERLKSGHTPLIFGGGAMMVLHDTLIEDM